MLRSARSAPLRSARPGLCLGLLPTLKRQARPADALLVVTVVRPERDLEERQRLQDDPGLLGLLRHYAEKGAADRTTWQDRVMHVEGADTAGLVQLHGSLLACDWVEMNVGCTAGTHVGAGMYRVTAEGLRALGQFAVGSADDADEVLVQREAKPKQERRPPRRKKVVTAAATPAPEDIAAVAEASPLVAEESDAAAEPSERRAA